MASSTIVLTGTHLIHLNRRNGTELVHRCVGQLRLRTSVFCRSLSVGSSSSPIFAVTKSEDCWAKLIDGKAVAETIRDEVELEVMRMEDSIGDVPRILIITFGREKDSAICVKKNAFRSVGMEPYQACLPADYTSEEKVLRYISIANECRFSGIIFQQPIPSKFDEERIFNALSIEKDVEGIKSLGLAMRGREDFLVPCTPKGCIELLRRYKVEMRGRRAVVIGRSEKVGIPTAMLLQKEDATVSIIHSRTKNPQEITREADIIISAVGKPNLVRGNWIKPGAVIIDVGINPVEDLNAFRGYRLVGDVCYEEACKIASAITPVPGGVAPMTIAMLLSNTLKAAKRLHNLTCGDDLS